MARRATTEQARLEIIRLCHMAIDSQTLRVDLIRRLQSVVPFDYVYFSTTDPATQLGTSSVLAEEPPPWMMSQFLDNEFLQEDFNKFNQMIKERETVSVLSAATRHELHRSQRYRDMLAPLGMGDELRAVFVADGACWGTLCLHRGVGGSGYSPAEAAFLAQIAPHIANGLRKSFLFDTISRRPAMEGPGVLVLTDDLSIVAATAAAEYWLTELSATGRDDKNALPLAVRSVVGGLLAIERGMLDPEFTPKVRLHTRSGQWLLLHASRLRNASGHNQISVVFEFAQPGEIMPLIIQAYDLTKREGQITQCVLRGWSTTEIAGQLHISTNTVQDHFKSIFGKVDVRSRGELAARIFAHQYQS